MEQLPEGGHPTIEAIRGFLEVGGGEGMTAAQGDAGEVLQQTAGVAPFLGRDFVEQILEGQAVIAFTAKEEGMRGGIEPDRRAARDASHTGFRRQSNHGS